MTYRESIQFLYSLGNELKPGAKFGLEQIRLLLEALGSPERGQRFVHVAGTNGKGSTCAMIASVLRKAGFRTGLYTSPHLQEPTERINVDGEPVSEAEFASAFDRVHAAAEELLRRGELEHHPSYFETVTAMAFLIFEERCDVVVLEVGLGGRLDATNVVEPELCVITPVSYDHEAYLGTTIESIAAEKAGILKSGFPVVMASQLPEAEQVIVARAQELGCPLIRVADTPISDVKVTPWGSSFTFEGFVSECGLAGRHQVENARAAILACRQLGIQVSAIQDGVKAARWAGRLEFVQHKPEFVLDGAHNPAGAAALASYIGEFWSERPVWIVYGAMRDKAIEEVTDQLFFLADRLIVTAPDMPRALRPEAILEITPCPTATVAANVKEAIDQVRWGAPKDAIVFFTGSLFLVSEARALLTKD